MVSVVIPAFNQAQVIGRALDSVAAQTFRDFEVIVVDDGSTDQTAEVVSGAGIAGLQMIRHQQNRGASAARNTGIAAAAGRLIAFLDSDDIWHSDKLARQVTALDRAPPNVKACASGYHLHKAGRKLTICPALQPGQLQTEILFGCTISPGTTLLVERSVFDDVGPFDNELRRLEDWDWLLRFAERHDILFLPDVLATIYVDHLKARSVRGEQDLIRQSIRHIGAKHLPRFQAMGGMPLRKFRSTLLLEIGAEGYRRRRPLQAAAYVLASLGIYPFRNAAFFRSLWRSIMSLARW
jgi:glycosyltransferase involved in cell wall biosynthesis